jgi:hypothetical protein
MACVPVNPRAVITAALEMTQPFICARGHNLMVGFICCSEAPSLALVPVGPLSDYRDGDGQPRIRRKLILNNARHLAWVRYWQG